MLTLITMSGSRYVVDEANKCVKRDAPVNLYCPPEMRSPVDQAWPNGEWASFERIELVDAPVIGEVQLYLAGAQDPALNHIRTSLVVSLTSD